MWAFLVRRVLTGLMTLLVVLVATFFLLRCLPGGPFDQDRALPPAIQQNIETLYHLHEPVPVQLGAYLLSVLRGDLGPSFKYRSRRVNDVIGESLPVSLLLGTLALVLGTCMGVVFGTWAGVTRRPWLDNLLSFFGVLSLSTPAFIMGGLLTLVFALWLRWLPAATLSSPLHWVLPVLTLSLTPFAYAFLLVRNTVSETRQQPYVLLKQSTGLSRTHIMLHHVLRNSLIPLLSMMGPLAAALVTGSFVVETLFAVPGLGKHFVTAVTNRDYPLVMGVTLVYSVLLVVLNTITDVLYGYLDPRLRELTVSSGGEAS